MSKTRASKKIMEVTIMFEPTRLANKHLADAYTRVVPGKLFTSEYPESTRYQPASFVEAATSPEQAS